MKLYKSDRKCYLYCMKVMDQYIYFGQPTALNMHYASDKRRGCYIADEGERASLKQQYYDCCKVNRLHDFKSRESLEYYLLFQHRSIRKSVNAYQKRFGVYVKVSKKQFPPKMERK